MGDQELPIVLVHGTMGKSEDWSRVVEKLSGSRTVIRPNYIERVAGRNSSNGLAVKDLADEVVAAVMAEGKQRFDLVGGSLGAAVAICIAAEYPQMVRSLVLVSGFSNGSDPRMNLQFKLWLRLMSTDKVAFTKLLLVSGLSPGFLSAFDEPTLNGIIENFIASTDWRPIEFSGCRYQITCDSKKSNNLANRGRKEDSDNWARINVKDSRRIDGNIHRISVSGWH